MTDILSTIGALMLDNIANTKYIRKLNADKLELYKILEHLTEPELVGEVTIRLYSIEDRVGTLSAQQATNRDSIKQLIKDMSIPRVVK